MIDKDDSSSSSSFESRLKQNVNVSLKGSKGGGIFA
jgi:hypothetical protein